MKKRNPQTNSEFTRVCAVLLSLAILLMAVGCGGGGVGAPAPNPGANPNPGATIPQASPTPDSSKITASADGAGFLLIEGEAGCVAPSAQVLIRDNNQITLSTFATADGRIGTTGDLAPAGFNTNPFTTLTITQIVAGYGESDPITVQVLGQLNITPLQPPLPLGP
ncbi:hypothetical protein JW859_14365 [bacterium]|nr:hypothetical protein [bacterium]